MSGDRAPFEIFDDGDKGGMPPALVRDSTRFTTGTAATTSGAVAADSFAARQAKERNQRWRCANIADGDKAKAPIDMALAVLARCRAVERQAYDATRLAAPNGSSLPTDPNEPVMVIDPTNANNNEHQRQSAITRMSGIVDAFLARADANARTPQENFVEYFNVPLFRGDNEHRTRVDASAVAQVLSWLTVKAEEHRYAEEHKRWRKRRRDEQLIDEDQEMGEEDKKRKRLELCEEEGPCGEEPKKTPTVPLLMKQPVPIHALAAMVLDSFYDSIPVDCEPKLTKLAPAASSQSPPPATATEVTLGAKAAVEQLLSLGGVAKKVVLAETDVLNDVSSPELQLCPSCDPRKEKKDHVSTLRPPAAEHLLDAYDHLVAKRDHLAAAQHCVHTKLLELSEGLDAFCDAVGEVKRVEAAFWRDVELADQEAEALSLLVDQLKATRKKIVAVAKAAKAPKNIDVAE